MEIKTKLEIGDECYFIRDDRLVRSVIKRIEITVVPHKLTDCEINVFYSMPYMGGNITQNERETFASLKEAMEFLERNIYEIH